MIRIYYFMKQRVFSFNIQDPKVKYFGSLKAIEIKKGRVKKKKIDTDRYRYLKRWGK